MAGLFPLGAGVRQAQLSRAPYPILRALQESEPVSWIEEIGLWYITRREDVMMILQDAATYTVVSPHSLLEDTFGRMMLSTDGEEHQRLRRPFTPLFTPKAVRQNNATFIEAKAHELIDAFESRGEVDLVTAFSDPLALYTVTAALGVPVQDFRIFRGWFTDIAHALGNFIGDAATRQRGRSAATAFGEQVAATLPKGCPVHQIQSNSDLNQEELLAALRVIIFGGLETTAALFSNTIWALLQHPEQLAAVRANPVLLSNALEETLRWESPVQTATRHLTRSVTLRGVTLRAGDTLQCMLGAANRDPAHFTQPDQFDLYRPNAADHLAFAIGKHFCLGAALARLEGQIGLRVLFERLPSLRFHPHHPTHPQGHEFRSPANFYVRFAN